MLKVYSIMSVIAVLHGSSPSTPTPVSLGGDNSSELPPLEPEPVSLYRRWIRYLFQKPPQATSVEYTTMVDHGDWIVVGLDRESQVFKEFFDPTVSGDWGPPSEDDDELSDFELLDAMSDSDYFIHEEDELDPVTWAFEFSSAERTYFWNKSILETLPEIPAEDFEVVDHFTTPTPAPVAPLPPYLQEQIVKDVERSRPEELRPDIHNLLEDFARSNPEIGYCQGMSYISSVLLQQSPDTARDAFNVLINHVNAGYYGADLGEYRRDVRRIQNFIYRVVGTARFRFPGDYTLDFLTLGMTDMFMTMFTKVFPTESAVKIFDVAFVLGRPGLFAVYVAAIDLVAEEVHSTITSSDEFEGLVNSLTLLRTRITEMGKSPEQFKTLIDTAKWYYSTYGEEFKSILRKDVDLEAHEEPFITTTTTTTTSTPTTPAPPVVAPPPPPPAAVSLFRHSPASRPKTKAKAIKAIRLPGNVDLGDFETVIETPPPQQVRHLRPRLPSAAVFLSGVEALVFGDDLDQTVVPRRRPDDGQREDLLEEVVSDVRSIWTTFTTEWNSVFRDDHGKRKEN
jgi:hypothetical protein